MSEQISKFVENIRVQVTNDTRDEPEPGTSQETKHNSQRTERREQQQQIDDRVESAKDKAQKYILEAEQCKALVNVPQGILDNPNYALDVKDDDEFFHITCHLDSVLHTKIEREEYVDLEKLSTA